MTSSPFSPSLPLCVLWDSLVSLGPIFAADTFPRGPGYYFHPAKLIVVILIYFAWLRTCWWVHTDCRAMKLPSETWNPILLACGIAGLVAVWLFPYFVLGLLVLLVLYLAPTDRKSVV